MNPYCLRPVSVAIVAVAMLWMNACQRMPTPANVHFIVPVGFRGMFSVASSPDGEVPPIVDGVIQISVPSNGMVTVNDAAFMKRLGSMSASYSDQTPLQAQMRQPLRPFSGQVSLYYATVDSHGTHYYFVGTDEAMSDVYATGEFVVGARPLSQERSGVLHGDWHRGVWSR